MTALNVRLVPPLLLTALPAVAHGQIFLCIPESSNETVIQLSAADGTVINTTFLDLATATNGVAETPIEVAQVVPQEIWISDQTADDVFRFDLGTLAFLGSSSAPLDNIRGMHPSGSGVLVANSGTNGGAPGEALVELDVVGALAGSTQISDPFDVEPYDWNGVPGYLVSDIDNEDIVFVEAADLSNQTIFHDSDGVTGIDFPQQIHVSPSGRIFVGGFSTPTGIYEYDSTGAQVDYIDTAALAGLGGVRGVWLLANDTILFTTGSGIHLYDPVANTANTVIPGVSARYISLVGTGLVLNYCQAAPNSTGVAATISAIGTPIVANNDVTLRAAGLPMNQFGTFLTSQMQGFLPGTGGTSNGNLCVAGQIGRFSNPGQILSSGTSGVIVLPIDLMQIPQGSGFVSISPGEDWYYQAWFRDPVGVGSNFTDGLEINYQ